MVLSAAGSATVAGAPANRAPTCQADCVCVSRLQAADGAASCGAVADRARSAAGMLRAALAALAEEAESHAVRQVQRGLSSVHEVVLTGSSGTAASAALWGQRILYFHRCCSSGEQKKPAGAGSRCVNGKLSLDSRSILLLCAQCSCTQV